jgi:hypothetical protein
MEMKNLVKSAINEELNRIEKETDPQVYNQMWSNITKGRNKKNVFEILKNINKPLIAISTSTLAVLLVFFILIPSRSLNVNAAAIAIDNNLTLIMNKVSSLPPTSSSNPYNYIINSNEFNNLVEIGPDALKIIKQRVDESSENGLKEYILAIAAERIAKVDLKGDNFGWSTAKEWSDKWNNHLKNLSTNFKDIIKSDKKSETKNAEVIKLGIPALPFIIDEVEQGNTDLLPALQKLVEGNKKISFDTNSVKDYKEWAKSNKENVQDLRELVN